LLIYNALAFLLGMLSLFIIANEVMANLLGFISGMLFLIGLAIKFNIIAVFNHLKANTQQSLSLFTWLTFGCFYASLQVIYWLNVSNKIIAKPQISQLNGYICSIPYQKNQTTRFDFCLVELNHKRLAFYQANKLAMVWGKYAPNPEQTIGAGQYWNIKAKLKPVYGRINPHSFDKQQWMLAQGYIGSASVKVGQPLVTESGLLAHYHKLRQHYYDRVMRLLTKASNVPSHLNQQQNSLKLNGFIVALLMGERNEIHAEQWLTLQHSGTSHLLAISGLHVGVAALWFYWLALLLWRRSERLCNFIAASKIAVAASWFGGLWVLLISGAGLPAQRAFIMLSLFLLTRLSGRYYSLLSILALSLFIILLTQPFAILSASFWLSFMAVFCIALVIKRQYGTNLISKTKHKINSWLIVNGYLYLLMIPTGLLFFSMFSLSAFFANLLLIPFTSFIVIPQLYISSSLMFIHQYTAIQLFKLSLWLIEIVYRVQQLLANGNLWLMKQLKELNIESVWLVLSLSLLIAIAFMPRKLILKVVYLPLSFIVVNLLTTHKKDLSPFEMVVFDIGQGLAVYIRSYKEHYLFDTGWGNQTFSLAESTIVPYLNAKGVKRIDKLIVSHSDSDHAGGVASILQNFAIKQLIVGDTLPQVESTMGTNLNTILTQAKQQVGCHDMPAWQSGEFHFKFLKHLQQPQAKSNNRSCVLSISFVQNGVMESEFTTDKKTEHKIKSKALILLTGDIEKSAELSLIKGNLSSHQILIAAHHGSKTSSTQTFINAVRPSHVIFSSGYANQWGLPKMSIINRFKQVGAKVWRTDLQGAIRVEFNQKIQTNQKLQFEQNAHLEKNSVPQLEEYQLSVFSQRMKDAHFWLQL
jgi:competence protein ComEC